jgi:hypothetical protein
MFHCGKELFLNLSRISNVAPFDFFASCNRSILQIPHSVRFLIAGAINNILFIVVLGMASTALEEKYAASTIYSVISVAMIPVGHASTCLLVFGWPSPYLTSLLSIAPIGFIGTALGTATTGALDKIHFDRKVYDQLSMWFPLIVTMKKDEHIPNTYSSLLVLAIVGIFSYVASNLVMGGGTKKVTKKE